MTVHKKESCQPDKICNRGTLKLTSTDMANTNFNNVIKILLHRLLLDQGIDIVCIMYKQKPSRNV